MPHCTENHIFLFQTSWKDGLSKTVALEYDLSCIIEKDQDQKSFSLILYLNRKMKMIVIKKIHRNMIFSWNFLKRWSFQKDRAGMGMIFFVLSGKMVFFLAKAWYFFLGQEVRDDLSQEIHGNMIFSVYTYGCYKRGVTPLCQKKIKDGLIPQKYT